MVGGDGGVGVSSARGGGGGQISKVGEGVEDDLLEMGPNGFEKELVGKVECPGGGGTNDGGGGITKRWVDCCLGGRETKSVGGSTVGLLDAIVELRGVGVVVDGGGGKTTSKWLFGSSCEWAKVAGVVVGSESISGGGGTIDGNDSEFFKGGGGTIWRVASGLFSS